MFIRQYGECYLICRERTARRQLTSPRRHRRDDEREKMMMMVGSDHKHNEKVLPTPTNFRFSSELRIITGPYSGIDF